VSRRDRPLRRWAWAQFHRDRSGARLAYGAGAQMTLGRFAIRAEYERINASEGDPDLLSLGLTLSF